MTLRFSILLCSLFVATGTVEQSLRTLAKDHGGTAENVLMMHFEAVTPSELLAQADTVVSGRIMAVRPHLTQNEDAVVTDYELVVTRIIKRDPNLDSALKPGPARPLIVRRKGGTVVEGELRYSTLVSAFPAKEEFSAGEDVVLFLSYDSVDRAYYFTDGPYGAFRVRSGEVVSMTRKANDRHEGSLGSLNAFVGGLEQSLRRK